MTLEPDQETARPDDELAARGLRMREDWERRAKRNPMYHIAASRSDWSTDDFYGQGPAMVGQMVDPVLRTLGARSGGRVLEIGCGMGRLFQGLAGRFDDVWGIDVAPEMLRLGRERCPVVATWVLGDGHSLQGVPDGSVDHVLSFEVLQHIPDLEIIDRYIAETGRVLRPGGTFQLQLRRGNDSPRQPVLRLLPGPLRRRAGTLLRAVGLSQVPGDIDTWLGRRYPVARARRVAGLARLTDLAILDDTMHRPGMGYWLIGRRPPEAAAPPR